MEKRKNKIFFQVFIENQKKKIFSFICRLEILRKEPKVFLLLFFFVDVKSEKRLRANDFTCGI